MDFWFIVFGTVALFSLALGVAGLVLLERAQRRLDDRRERLDRIFGRDDE